MSDDRERERLHYIERMAYAQRIASHPDGAEIRHFDALAGGCTESEILLSTAICAFLVGVSESVSSPEERTMAVRTSMMLAVSSLGPLIKGPQGDRLATAWRECYRAICIARGRLPQRFEDLELEDMIDALSLSPEEWEEDTRHEPLEREWT